MKNWWTPCVAEYSPTENKGGQSDSASDSLNAPAVEEAASDSDSLTAPAATDSNTVEGSATETANN